MLDAARRQRILKNAEESLKRNLKNQENAEIISLAVEKVRLAKLSLFKGQRVIAKFIDKPNQSEQNHLQNLEEQELDWKGKTIKEIISIYKSNI